MIPAVSRCEVWFDATMTGCCTRSSRSCPRTVGDAAATVGGEHGELLQVRACAVRPRLARPRRLERALGLQRRSRLSDAGAVQAAASASLSRPSSARRADPRSSGRHFRQEQRRAVQVRDRRRPSNGLRRHLERVAHRRGRAEAESCDDVGVSTEEDDVAEVVHRVRRPVPHVERVHAVIRVRRPVQVPVPLVARRTASRSAPRSASGPSCRRGRRRRSRCSSGGAPDGTPARVGCATIITPPGRTSGAFR